MAPHEQSGVESSIDGYYDFAGALLAPGRNRVQFWDDDWVRDICGAVGLNVEACKKLAAQRN